MIDAGMFQAYNFLMGVITGLGLLLVLYLQRQVLAVRRFFVVMFVGLFFLGAGGPILEVLAPALVHVAHTIGAVFVIYGLYDPLDNELRDREWSVLLLRDPTRIRLSPDWMSPMDDEILRLFQTTDLVLTPAMVGYNIDRSREEVNRRLSELTDHGLVERVERGKYRITPLGAAYLSGEPINETDVASDHDQGS